MKTIRNVASAIFLFAMLALGTFHSAIASNASPSVPNASGVVSVSGGANALAPTDGNIADQESAVDNANGNMLDHYTGSSAGTKRVVALQDVDVGVRHTGSFAAMKDALTT